MSSIFTKIIRREIPAYIVAEDEVHIAFLDVRPVKKGHTLVVPKQEIDYIFDMSDEALSRLNVFAKKVALGLKQAVPCKRIGTAVVGLEVPHVHIHLIPMDSIADIDFTKPRLEFTKDEYESLVRDISARI